MAARESVALSERVQIPLATQTKPREITSYLTG